MPTKQISRRPLDCGDRDVLISFWNAHQKVSTKDIYQISGRLSTLRHPLAPIDPQEVEKFMEHICGLKAKPRQERETIIQKMIQCNGITLRPVFEETIQPTLEGTIPSSYKRYIDIHRTQVFVSNELKSKQVPLWKKILGV